jgi:hypothetical protein
MGLNKKQMSIQELAMTLQQKGCILTGCSRQQITKIEQKLQINFPNTYVDYLLLMGKNAGQFMMGSSAFIDDLIEMQENASELLDGNDFKPLPENAFVFFMHQGYQFALFHLTEGDNPPIYYYYEGRNIDDFERAEDSLTDFLAKQIKMSGLG